MTTPADQVREARARAARRADQWTRRAVLDMVGESGGVLTERPIYEGSAVTRPDAEPMDALRTIGSGEAAARNAGRRYIRHAREAGSTWHEIAGALGLTAGDGETAAEAAYTYAAGSPDSDYARRYGRSFTWTCPSCDGTIHDRGLLSGPANDEEGHGRDCIRLAEAEAEWDAQWEAEA
jgi:hypothetical protein